MKTESLDCVFPTTLDDQNKITHRYVTTTLFPQVGALTARSIIGVVEDTIKQLEDLQQKLVQLDPSKAQDRWKNLHKLLGDVYQDKFDKPIGQIWLDAHKEISDYLQNPEALTPPQFIPGISNTFNSRDTSSLFTLREAVSVTSTKPLASSISITQNGLISVRSTELTNNISDTIRKLATQLASDEAIDESELKKSIASQEDFLLDHSIVKLFVEDKWLVRALTKSELMATSEQFVSEQIFKNNTLNIRNVILSAHKQMNAGLSLEHLEKIQPIVATILSKHYKNKDKAHPALQIFGSKDTALKFSSLIYSLAWAPWWKNVYLGYKTPDLDDYLSMEAQREWGFLRYERLDFYLSKPKLRGPVSAESLPPQATLTIKDELSSSTEQAAIIYQSTSTSTELKSTLTNAGHFEGLVDASYYTENDHGDSELLSRTLSEQRRERIDSVVNEASQRNDTAQAQRSLNTVTRHREFSTTGQDPDNATTQLSFQIVTPVEARASLEDVGLVWCPRISNPFLKLRQQLQMVKKKTYEEYLAENPITKPFRFESQYETKTFVAPATTQPTVNLKKGAVISLDIELPKEDIDKGFRVSPGKCVCRVDVHYQFNAHFIVECTLHQVDQHIVHVFTNVEIESFGESHQKATITIDDDFLTDLIARDDVYAKYLNDPNFLIDRCVAYFYFQFELTRETDESKASDHVYQVEYSEYLKSQDATIGRARQYSRMRYNEALAQYENSRIQKELAFGYLMQNCFGLEQEGRYVGIIKSCIDWEKVEILPQPTRQSWVFFTGLPINNILNARALNFILPIRQASEQAFFMAFEAATDSILAGEVASVRKYIERYRKIIGDLRASDPPKELLLDSYKTELILGRHYEAVLSNSSFVE